MIAIAKLKPKRKRYRLTGSGFTEVPKRYRKYYRHWKGADDCLAPNEVLCPVCKIVIRTSREIRVGDHVFCMPCNTRLVVTKNNQGMMIGKSIY
mgnify:CR=1 FL=1